MIEGLEKDISIVCVGNLVMDGEMFDPLTVSNLWSEQVDKYILIETDKANVFQVTKGQPIYQGNGCIRTEHLEAGSIVYGTFGDKMTVKSIYELDRKGSFCNFEFGSEGTDSLYVAQGIVVGDMMVEFKLKPEESRGPCETEIEEIRREAERIRSDCFE